jgi:predicted secreted protein
MNPILKLQNDLSTLSKLNSQLNSLLSQIRAHNSSLIQENVRLENSLELAKDAVTEFCDKCTLQAGQQCKTCPAYKFAVSNNLWQTEG